jgi:hypothetical protein
MYRSAIVHASAASTTFAFVALAAFATIAALAETFTASALSAAILTASALDVSIAACPSATAFIAASSNSLHQFDNH